MKTTEGCGLLGTRAATEAQSQPALISRDSTHPFRCQVKSDMSVAAAG